VIETLSTLKPEGGGTSFPSSFGPVVWLQLHIERTALTVYCQSLMSIAQSRVYVPKQLFIIASIPPCCSVSEERLYSARKLLNFFIVFKAWEVVENQQGP